MHRCARTPDCEGPEVGDLDDSKRTRCIQRGIPSPASQRSSQWERSPKSDVGEPQGHRSSRSARPSWQLQTPAAPLGIHESPRQHHQPARSHPQSPDWGPRRGGITPREHRLAVTPSSGRTPSEGARLHHLAQEWERSKRQVMPNSRLISRACPCYAGSRSRPCASTATFRRGSGSP